MPLFPAAKLLVQAIVICSSLMQVQCLNFNYQSFSTADANDFVFLNSSIIRNTIQVSPVIADASGRILYNQPLKLWDKLRGTKSSFSSTFVINIRPQTTPGGEGLAFILTDSTTLPSNSAGQWLGIVNVSTINVNSIVAVAFDTRKSDSEDVDDNHVGVDLKSIYSIKQEPLIGHGVNLSSSEDITASIQYDAKSDKMTVFVVLTRTSEQNMGNPIFTVELDLSKHLPEDVFLGFSGSTGENTQLDFPTCYIGDTKTDFIAEVTTITNLHHKNLVKLLGWCYESDELLLVYEFMPNGSLDRFIFGNTIPSNADTTLKWETRHNIICGVARALDYLHNGCEKRVIHRDIKASNIMLDSDFNARLGDFGLARTVQLNEKTHHSTKEIAGTPGYMSPESFHTGKATVETDVYAFGVLILEVVSGRKPGHQNEQNNYYRSIVEWVWEHHRMEQITDVIYLRLNKDFHEDQARCILMLGLACCHPNPFERPSMRTALQVLTGEVAAPAVPTEMPAFMWPAAPPVIREEMDNSITGGHLTTTTELSGR
ncbi:Protein kinase domain - like 10 [Theobroma cacao]|nr:Protein kinase domain - like 10 [Theobroma cacao]